MVVRRGAESRGFTLIELTVVGSYCGWSGHEREQG
jgi:hypothetical protein